MIRRRRGPVRLAASSACETTRRRAALVLAALLLPAASSAAWHAEPARRARTDVVTGVVRDSIGARPLADALVQLLRADSGGTGPRSFFARTDARGAFRMDSVEPGAYLAGFFHPALDSLGLQVAPRRIVVDGTTRVDLAIPSAATVTRTLCAAGSISDTTALLLGWVRDARTGEARGGGTIAMQWGEIVIGRGGVKREMQKLSVSASSAGWYALCGVPTGIEIALTAAAAADSSGVVFAQLAGRRLAVHDLYVGPVESVPAPTAGDSAALGAVLRRGSARVVGTVRGAAGRAIAGAQVVVRGSTAMATTGEEGAFTLAGVPAGSQTLEARGIGFLPARATVHVRAGDEPTSVSFEMTNLKAYLDTIRVTTTRVFDRDRTGFERRRRTGAGYFVTRENIERRAPITVSQLFQEIPGIDVLLSTFGYEVRMRGAWGRCRPDIVLDGMRLSSQSMGQDDPMSLDMLVRPDEVQGIEVYTRDTRVPAEYSSMSGCGAIVVWTRPPLPRQPEPKQEP